MSSITGKRDEATTSVSTEEEDWSHTSPKVFKCELILGTIAGQFETPSVLFPSTLGNKVYHDCSNPKQTARSVSLSNKK